MHPAVPLASLIADSQAAALQVLARTDAGMTGRQVARVAGAAQHTSIKRALDKLEHVGLVAVERSPQHSTYRLNRDHVLWAAVEAALNANDVLRNRIRTFLADKKDVLSAAIFGSVAAGTARDDSDVDIVLIYANDTNTDIATELGGNVERWTGNLCEVFDLTRAELADYIAADDPIVTFWKQNAETVYGADFQPMLTRGIGVGT